jgi:flavin reductase (DIM6/NTAB) family NADH-FMN oxidoreductase RutF
MTNESSQKMVELEIDGNLWNRSFAVHSLVIIGSKEEDGSYNLAPKHMAMPLGFSPYFAFIGTARKSTYQNIKREKVFTVSYPSPNQLVISSLTASQREKNNTKPIIDQIPTVEAQKIEGRLLKDAYFHLECRLSEFMGKFGEWELVVGKIEAAYAQKAALKRTGEDRSDNQLIYENPLLAYVHPDRFSVIKETHAFPFPKDFKR